MDWITRLDSPVGGLTLASDGTALTGLWIAGQKYHSLGLEPGARAVGGAVGHNPISIIIPCHRVIGANGKLTGYAAGLDVKLQLLRLEGRSESFLEPT